MAETIHAEPSEQFTMQEILANRADLSRNSLLRSPILKPLGLSKGFWQLQGACFQVYAAFYLFLIPQMLKPLDLRLVDRPSDLRGDGPAGQRRVAEGPALVPLAPGRPPLQY